MLRFAGSCKSLLPHWSTETITKKEVIATVCKTMLNLPKRPNRHHDNLRDDGIQKSSQKDRIDSRRHDVTTMFQIGTQKRRHIQECKEERQGHPEAYEYCRCSNVFRAMWVVFLKQGLSFLKRTKQGQWLPERLTAASLSSGKSSETAEAMQQYIAKESRRAHTDTRDLLCLPAYLLLWCTLSH